MDLKTAVDILDGPTEAARLSGIKRTSIHYWLEKGAPAWRQADVARLIEMADLKQKMAKSDEKPPAQPPEKTDEKAA